MDKITVGTFAAVYLANWDKVPVIGKVLEATENNIKLHYWKGTYKGKWSPQYAPRSRLPWEDELPKACIILCSFSLADDSRLLPTTRKHLQEAYARLKNQVND